MKAKIVIFFRNESVNRTKQWIKSFPQLVNLKRKIWSIYDGYFNTTKLNITQVFPIYLPFSAGNYNDRAALTIEAINQVFPFLNSLAKYVKKEEIVVKNIECLSLDASDRSSGSKLKELLDSYGSDKATQHNYHLLYGAILRDKDTITNIFEIGLGSNNIDVVSNMGVNGKPGASLRAFRDFCPNASVFGADVDRRILFEEERIKTFFVDQTKPVTFDPILKNIPSNFDLVIDDGLHSPNANIASLEFGLKIVKIGGWVVVEDIFHEAICVWQTVSALMPDAYESHIFSTKRGVVFAVKRLY